MEIKKIIRQAKSGDEKAFKFLLEKYWDDVFRFQLSLINNTNEAEDITIETFAKAFEKIHTFNDKFDFKPWLLTISKNIYNDRKRKTKSGERFISIDQNDSHGKNKILSIPDQSGEEDKVILEQQLQIIMQALNHLKPKYREVLKLRYFEGLSYKQIAERTGESLNNIRVRLMRAKKLLVEQINNQNHARD